MLNFDRLMETVAGKQIYYMGLQKGLVTARQRLLDALNTRFGIVPKEMVDQIAAIKRPDVLKNLHKEAILCPDIDSFSERMSSEAAENERKRQTDIKHQVQEPNRQTQQQTREKQQIGWQELKPTLIVVALIGLGCILTIFSVNIFDSLKISFLGESRYYNESGFIVGLLLSILLVGQYLWRHRQTMPHLAMIFGLLIGVGWVIYLIPVIIFGSLKISFLGDDRGASTASGIIVGLLLSILLVGQYLWRHRQTMPPSAVITGVIGILGIAIWPFLILFK